MMALTVMLNDSMPTLDAQLGGISRSPNILSITMLAIAKNEISQKPP
jgi:hypothetical protein